MEVVATGDAVAQLDDIVSGELDDASASAADHVIVRAFAEGVLVVRLLYAEVDLLKNAATNQQWQRSVDRGLTHSLTALA